MDSIGVTLREERERRGLSLEGVSDSTKITVQNLSAIEEDRFEFFPNRVYARAFLRDYANFFGLDSGALLGHYEEQRAGVTEPVIEAPVQRKRRWPALGVAALVLGILLFAAVAAFVGWRFYEESREIAASTSARHRQKRVKKPLAPPAPSTSQPPVTAAVPSPGTAPGASSTPTPMGPAKPTATGSDTPTSSAPVTPTAPGMTAIKLTAVGQVWVSVKVDGQTKLFEIIPAGTTRVFEGRKIQVRAGRANAVQIEHDGKSELLAPQSIPKTVVYTAPQVAPR